MSETSAKPVRIWLYSLGILIAAMIVVGGYVRLTRAGLSIVEWNAITGVVPPIGEAAWQAEFTKYQATPEFQKVNTAMTLAEYQRIFLIEWAHRLIARLVGLVVLLPLAVFLIRRTIPWRKSAVYLLILALFGFQGFLGWFMVASGLVDRPHVSHYRLTIHLLTALTVLAICLWQALNLTPRFVAVRRQAAIPRQKTLVILLLVVVIVQVAYGGLVAGLKAGHASNTWPTMFGYLVPPGLLSVLQPWWQNLVETPATVHFIHRWFAFVVLIVAAILYYRARKTSDARTVQQGAIVLMLIVGVQITLGISVVLFGVALPLALLHQATAILLFVTALFLTHQEWRQPGPQRKPSSGVRKTRKR